MAVPEAWEGGEEKERGEKGGEMAIHVDCSDCACNCRRSSAASPAVACSPCSQRGRQPGRKLLVLVPLVIPGTTVHGAKGDGGGRGGGHPYVDSCGFACNC